MWDGKVKHKNSAVMRFYLALSFNVKTADAHFHYAECGMFKLFQDSSIAKLYMNIKL